MYRFILFISLFLFTSVIINAQNIPDSFSMRPKKLSWTMPPEISMQSPRFGFEIMKRHPYFGFSAEPSVRPASEIRKVHGKEWMFYLLVLLLIIFALLKRAFPKYFSDMYRLFFRTTLKQRQIREQLMQTPLPSLMLNVFFVITGGLYLSMLAEHYAVNPVGNFWLLSFYCAIGLATAYFIKYLGLKVSGWLFNMEAVADAYIFIIFIINKMLGIMLLPLLILLAFTLGGLYSTTLALSWCILGALLIYRFILTYGAVRNQVKVNPFHFFLYILAFEIAPLLLVYKGLLVFFRITA